MCGDCTCFLILRNSDTLSYLSSLSTESKQNIIFSVRANSAFPFFVFNLNVNDERAGCGGRQKPSVRRRKRAMHYGDARARGMSAYADMDVHPASYGSGFAGLGTGHAPGIGNYGRIPVGGSDYGYYNVGGIQPLVPQRMVIAGEGRHFDPYAEELGRNREGRSRRTSPRRSASRSQSGGRDGRGRGRRRDFEAEDSRSEEASDDSEVAQRVEGVEEELRALVEDKRERDAEVHKQIGQALSLAKRIGSGLSSPTLASLFLSSSALISTLANTPATCFEPVDRAALPFSSDSM